MIATVTTVTTVTTMVSLGLTTVISGLALVALLVFLATQELAGASNSRFASHIARFAGVGILPLVMTFAVIVIVRITEVL